MNKITYILLLTVGIVFFNSCIETVNQHSQLPPGIWRGELILESDNFIPEEGDEEVQTEVQKLNDKKLPFNFRIEYNDENQMEVFIINGEEELQVDNVLYGRDKSIAKDSFRFEFLTFDSYISGYYEDNAIEGVYVLKNKNNYTLPFRAKYGVDYRFTNLKKEPVANLSGKWECTFEAGTKDESKAIGEFSQKGNDLTGTFVTETGDYRYLHGTVQGSNAYLSTFDGTHVFLFTMNIMNQDSLEGIFRSGKHYKSYWKAIRNEDFQLRHPDSLTFVTQKQSILKLDFPNPQGDIVSLSDFNAPVQIVTIFGTWCPNCYDEMNFLKEIKSKYNDQVEIVGIAYERYREQEKNLETIKNYQENMQIEFPLLLGGQASKKEASEDFPMLNKIISFPTLMMIDNKGEIRYIHTGFSGPATSKYKEFKTNFISKIDEILKTSTENEK